MLQCGIAVLWGDVSPLRVKNETVDLSGWEYTAAWYQELGFGCQLFTGAERAG